FGADSAQQVIAEVGVQASTFPSAAHLASWVGTNPGRQESAEQNQSSRSAKGNKFVRRILTEAAQAAVKTKGSHFQVVFLCLMPRLGYKQALWAIAHRLCRMVWKILHDGVRYVEQGAQRDPKALKQRMHTMARSLRQLGYDVNLDITPHSALARSCSSKGIFDGGDFRRSGAEEAAVSLSPQQIPSGRNPQPAIPSGVTP